jgi:hypothetical protein
MFAILAITDSDISLIGPFDSKSQAEDWALWNLDDRRWHAIAIESTETIVLNMMDP